MDAVIRDEAVSTLAEQEISGEILLEKYAKGNEASVTDVRRRGLPFVGAGALDVAAHEVLAGLAVVVREHQLRQRALVGLALLAHDQWTFRSELKLAQFWVDRYFDHRETSVLTARESLNQLSATEINIALPSLNESLSAIQNIKLGKESR